MNLLTSAKWKQTTGCPKVEYISGAPVKSEECQVSLCLMFPHQQLYFLQKLNKFGLNPKTLTSFYHCTIESILTGCITVLYGSCSAHNSKAIQSVVKTAELWVTDNKLPAIYESHCLRKAHKITSNLSYPAHSLFSELPSGKHFWSLHSWISQIKNRFYPQASKKPTDRSSVFQISPNNLIQFSVVFLLATPLSLGYFTQL